MTYPENNMPNTDFSTFTVKVRNAIRHHSNGVHNGISVIDTDFLVKLYVAVAHTTRLGRVMNATQERLNNRGVTPQAIPMRTRDGSDVLRDKEGNIRWLTKKRHAQMWTMEKFREMRREKTGLKREEPIYISPWSELPQGLREALENKLPLKKDNKPTFEPFALGFVFRAGDKPSKGEARNSWKRPQWVILGEYGKVETEEGENVPRVMVATGLVSWLSGRTKDFVEVLGMEERYIPVWGNRNSSSEVTVFAFSGIGSSSRERDFIDMLRR